MTKEKESQVNLSPPSFVQKTHKETGELLPMILFMIPQLCAKFKVNQSGVTDAASVILHVKGDKRENDISEGVRPWRNLTQRSGSATEASSLTEILLTSRRPRINPLYNS